MPPDVLPETTKKCAVPEPTHCTTEVPAPGMSVLVVNTIGDIPSFTGLHRLASPTGSEYL